MQKLNLENQKFGKLTVIEKSTPVPGGKLVKRTWGTWKCLCDCGKEVIIKTVHLQRGHVKSCGCLISENGTRLKPGEKINRLTTISFKNGKWLCECECGEKINIATVCITSGNTKSCGCYKTMVSKDKDRMDRLQTFVRKYEPKIASARRVWKQYCYRDKLCDISFNKFLEISQKNCFYCNIEPYAESNYFIIQSSRGSESAKQNGLFIYNGLDRINSNLHHTIDNVVPCCYQCNKGKNNSTEVEFLKRILNFNSTISNINWQSLALPENRSKATSIRCIFYNYKDTDMTVEEFYYASQLACFYCNSLSSNTFNRAKTDKKSSYKAKMEGDFIYNGLDRIDSALSHIKSNVVTCCKFCNFAKGKSTTEEFANWMIRIKNYQEKK